MCQILFLPSGEIVSDTFFPHWLWKRVWHVFFLPQNHVWHLFQQYTLKMCQTCFCLVLNLCLTVFWKWQTFSWPPDNDYGLYWRRVFSLTWLLMTFLKLRAHYPAFKKVTCPITLFSKLDTALYLCPVGNLSFKITPNHYLLLQRIFHCLRNNSICFSMTCGSEQVFETGYFLDTRGRFWEYSFLMPLRDSQSWYEVLSNFC